MVVMDNCAIHRKADIQDLCASVGAVAVFLPPYSPMFNPIEKLFGTVKQYFKSNREVIATLDAWAAIDLAFSSVPASACEAWVRGVECYNT